MVGIQNELEETHQELDGGMESYTELEEEYYKLKNSLHILGLTYVGARCRGLHRFNRINWRYIYQRNRANQADQALVLCQNHGNFLKSWELYGHLTIRAQKRCNVTLLTEKFVQQQLILNLREQIILL